jgi:hypothetical protein
MDLRDVIVDDFLGLLDFLQELEVGSCMIIYNGFFCDLELMMDSGLGLLVFC